MAKAAANKKTAAKASSAKGGKMLVIVESPSKAKTIGKYLGSKYKIMASVGHVRDLPKSKLGIDIENDFVRATRRGCGRCPSSRKGRYTWPAWQ